MIIVRRRARRLWGKEHEAEFKVTNETYQNRNKSDGNGDASSSSSSSNPIYPAGSFAFNTTLRETRTDCTSNPSTWRCYPYNIGGSATFFWTISPSKKSDSYTISSVDNPFAPSFGSLELNVTDPGLRTEHFVFSFSMNRTVIPDSALTPGNRAAKCNFDNTNFEATFWVRQRDGLAFDPPEKGSTHFTQWPGDVQVVQKEEFSLGQPMCEDSSGEIIADVQAGLGNCECRYGNYD